jgi:hypothetical protein
MPVRMRGNKMYLTVHERLAAAHGEQAQPRGIASITTEAFAVGPAVLVRATVTFTDGRVFTGLSQAQFDATTGADATNPTECAETSAVGRALAFAGYPGSEDGLAGAEEVAQAQRREAQLERARAAGPRSVPPRVEQGGAGEADDGYRPAAPSDPVAPWPEVRPPRTGGGGGTGPATDTQRTAVRTLSQSLGRPAPADLDTWTRERAGQTILALDRELEGRRHR